MPNKEPTNRDLLKALTDMNTRIIALETWKMNEDAYRAALAKVKAEEKEAKTEAETGDYLKRRTEIMKQVGIVLGLIAAILYAYATTRGISTP